MSKKSIFISGLIAITAVAGIAFYYINQPDLNNIGGITTINATDTLKNSRTVINNNFTDLNNNKLDNADMVGDEGITYTATGTISFDCSEVEGAGIDCSGEDITLDNTGDWTGTFDGMDSSAFLAGASGFPMYLGQVGDVATTTLNNGNVLIYNSTSHKWESSATSSLGITGGGTGSGTVNSGTTGQLAYYAGSGTTVSGTSSILLDGSGLTLGSGSDVITIDSAGNVGIATSSPARTLSVYGDFYLEGMMYDSFSSPGQNNYVLTSTGSGVKWVATTTLGFGSGGSGSGTVNSGSANQIAYYAGAGTEVSGTSTISIDSSSNTTIGIGSTIMTLSAAGYVGIATTSPSFLLDVSGNSRIFGSLTAANLTATGTLTAAQICLAGDCKIAWPTSSGGSSIWATSSATQLYVNSYNVGIGTTSPSFTLDVNGNIRNNGSISTQTLTATGTAYLTTVSLTGTMTLTGTISAKSGTLLLPVASYTLPAQNGEVKIASTSNMLAYAVNQNPFLLTPYLDINKVIASSTVTAGGGSTAATTSPALVFQNIATSTTWLNFSCVTDTGSTTLNICQAAAGTTCISATKINCDSTYADNTVTLASNNIFGAYAPFYVFIRTSTAFNYLSFIIHPKITP